ncbi:uncharacterized protein Z520_08407 [Fonsecaea multimorphosa CBS 102226]|uniref:DUF6590 domain-containing protein n=1 Tax=Fonsecaea multimorphosa CBS 102226 TaxID=1442371 RepID=A0A0D2H1I8_9EURO|nr:uncharacterized protein Z520_08407 [Fonsecaea multimorphosa CBS 102226]KIX95700.1 hypothetical protein Z520_08407 [Fonsecaea multimorphosa CBS 102226]OAL21437.1 hypothetical protein AYO22_07833 [Fonsecaea multimorphosa]
MAYFNSMNSNRTSGTGSGWRQSWSPSRDMSAPWRRLSGPSPTDSQGFGITEADRPPLIPRSHPDGVAYAGTVPQTPTGTFPTSSSISCLDPTNYRRKFQIHSIYELAAGTIIRGLHVSEAVDSVSRSDRRASRQTFNEESETWTKRIMHKHRHFIVVQVYDSHYVALPVFTNAGRGLAPVPQHEKKHYMSIRDHRTDNFECQNPELPVLVTEEMEPHSANLAPNSVVKFTIPQTFLITNEIEIVGQLTGWSTAVLSKHYRRDDGEVVGEPTPEHIQRVTEAARLARLRQQEFKVAFADGPSHGGLQRFRRQTMSRSPSSPRWGVRDESRRRSYSPDSLGDVPMRDARPADPPPPNVSNRFDMLRDELR